MKKLFFFLLVILIVASSDSFAQFRGYGIKGGVQFNGAMTFNELKNDQFSFLARGFLDVELAKMLALELGIGYGSYNCTYDYIEDYPKTKIATNIIPIDLRLKIAPFNMKSVNPYGYIGLGALNYSVSDFPTTPLSNTPTAQTLYYYAEKRKGWTGVVPVGLGVEIRLAEKVALDINSGFNFTGGDAINNIIFGDNTDHWAHLGLGFVFGGPKIDADEDRDGLKTSYEERIGTDPLNPDTDGDGLKDGDEVLKYKTNPLVADTDNDGLKDGDEVLKYKTDPLKIDTDSGTINDGVEVSRGTNPLDSGDDIPKPKVVIETGKSLVLEGIVFESGKSTILPSSEETLNKAFTILSENPDINVEIQGHTDNQGNKKKNMKLSLDRADAVKTWLVKKGIDPLRMTTKGFGPDMPIADNKTPEGRQKNRRIEFFRTK